MYIKIFRAFIFLALLSHLSVAFAASPIIMNGDAHVGEQAVLSVEAFLRAVPLNGRSVRRQVRPPIEFH